MRKLELTTWERVNLAGIISQQRGNLAQVRRFLRLLDELELTEEEKEFVGWNLRVVVDEGDNRVELPQWARDKANHLFEVVLEDADFDLLRKTALGFDKWTINQPTLVMLEKLENPQEYQEGGEADV
jgi:hypothetical protein